MLRGDGLLELRFAWVVHEKKKKKKKKKKKTETHTGNKRLLAPALETEIFRTQAFTPARLLPRNLRSCLAPFCGSWYLAGKSCVHKPDLPRRHDDSLKVILFPCVNQGKQILYPTSA